MIAPRYTLIFCALIGSLTAQSGAVSDRPYLLSELSDYAVKNRSDVVAWDWHIQALHEEEWVAISGYMPQITVAGLFQTSQANILPKKQGVLTVDQLIYSAAGPQLALEQACARKRIAELQKEDTEADVLNQVRKSFMGYWLQLRGTPLQDAIQKSAPFRYSNAVTAQKVGALSELDLYAAQTRLSRAMTEVAVWNTTTEKNKALLTTAVEKPVERIINPDVLKLLGQTINAVGAIPLADYIDDAMKNRWELPILDEEIELADIAARKALYSYIPTLSLNANFYQSRYHNPLTQLLDFFPWNVSLQISWQFDGFSNLAQMHSANAQRLEKICTKKRTEFAIRQEVQSAYYDFKNDVEQLKRETIINQEEYKKYLRNKKAYDVGLISETDFATALVEWENAKFQLAKKTSDTSLAYEDLIFQAGYPDHRASLIAAAAKPEKESVIL